MFLPAFLVLGLAAQHTTLEVRGQQQDVYHILPPGERRGAVLYLPGDGGWRGFAIEMAESLADGGYEVYALDTKRYLMSFTGTGTLNKEEIGKDLMEIARRTAGANSLYVGWSQGAAMGALAASTVGSEQVFRGYVLIGLPDHAVLGWRMVDNITYLTKKDPSEPMFQTAPALARTRGQPLAVLASKSDEYTPPDKMQALMQHVSGPKKFVLLEAKNHKFEGNVAGFFRALEEAAEWASDKH